MDTKKAFQLFTSQPERSLQTMYIVFIFLILLYFNVETVPRDIEVLNSGLEKIGKDDMLLTFFVTIHHHGEKARSVMATVVECCEKVTDEDIDCGLIQIFGEYLGILRPNTRRNITFLYPNVYGYNRRGYCTVGIWNRGEGEPDSHEIRHKIDFDTTIYFTPEGVSPFLSGTYAAEKLGKCDTTDLDPFDACNPVDCRLKYSGLRNYFNHKRKRCQKVPICDGDASKELPDVAYVPFSNTCKNLEKMVTKQNIKTLASNKLESGCDGDLESSMVNIQCHHGEIDVRTGLCICDKGWKSDVFDPEAYSGGSVVYHMCDKKCHPEISPQFKVTPFLIGVALAIWILFLILLCENCDYFCEFFKKDDEAEEISYYHVAEH